MPTPSALGRAGRAALATTVAIVAIALAAGPGSLANAHPARRAAAPGAVVRVAHFSPDTPPMDVYAAGFDGQESLVLPKLGFGQVSQYMNLPAGTYAFSMRPQGSPATSTAALRVSAALDEGGIYTFAAFGRQDALRTDLLSDDMTAPGGGRARVRIIQAAGDSGPVDVTTTAAALFASRSRLAAVGPYVDVPAGSVTVSAAADGVEPVEAGLDLAAGTVSSVVVLDEPTTGGIQVVRVTDGSGTGGAVATPTGMPAGGIDTGAGGTAAATGWRAPVPLVAAAGLVVVAAAAWFACALTGARRRRPT